MKIVVIAKTIIEEIEVDDDVTLAEIKEYIESEKPGYELLEIYREDDPKIPS